MLTFVIFISVKGVLTNKKYKEGVMKSSQSGVKLSLVIVSIIILGVSAWFNQANAEDTPSKIQTQSELTIAD
ncbi:hypothetical protein CXF64_19135 [Pseudoalteromonas sp. GutCa3]|nr:hypothetical protein CXF75_08685 [Pseudoalteromonas arctica]PKG69021.1 hypothetical protein CXF64_19135 [Pseudoalteromonas sp. GutCa3]